MNKFLVNICTVEQLKNMIAHGKENAFHSRDRWDRERIAEQALANHTDFSRNEVYELKLRGQVVQLLKAHCRMVHVSREQTVSAISQATGVRLDYLTGSSCTAIKEVISLLSQVADNETTERLEVQVLGLQERANKKARDQQVAQATAKLAMLKL